MKSWHERLVFLFYVNTEIYIRRMTAWSVDWSQIYKTLPKIKRMLKYWFLPCEYSNYHNESHIKVDNETYI